MCFHQGTPKFCAGHRQYESVEFCVGSKFYDTLESSGRNWSPMTPQSKNKNSAKTKLLCSPVLLGLRKQNEGEEVQAETPLWFPSCPDQNNHRKTLLITELLGQ